MFYRHMYGRSSVLWVGLIAAAGLVLGTITSVYFRQDAPSSEVEAAPSLSGARLLSQSRAITDFALEDMHGMPFNKARLEGRWHVLFFGFTNCPDVCPLTLATLAQALKIKPQLKDKLTVVFVSVDPQRDETAALREYVTYFDPDFLGITGDHPQLAALTRQLGTLYVIDPDQVGGNQYNVDHGASLILMSPAARMVGDIPPPHDARTVAEDLARIISQT